MDRYEEEFSFDQNDVELFAQISGDNNPIHIDPVKASKSIFGKPVIHGLLGASKISKVLGMNLPGEGMIYLGQSLKFLMPMYTGLRYKVVVEILEIMRARGRAKISTNIYDNDHNIVIEGEALVKNDNYKE